MYLSKMDLEALLKVSKRQLFVLCGVYKQCVCGGGCGCGCVHFDG